MGKKRFIGITICVLIIVVVTVIFVNCIYPNIKSHCQAWNYRNHMIKKLHSYRHSDDVQHIAEKGLALFREGKTITRFKDGNYTDPIDNAKGYECWTNGRIIEIDRDSDGHRETVFNVTDDDNVVYVGSVGGDGRYLDVGKGFEYMLGKSADETERLFKAH